MTVNPPAVAGRIAVRGRTAEPVDVVEEGRSDVLVRYHRVAPGIERGRTVSPGDRDRERNPQGRLIDETLPGGDPVLAEEHAVVGEVQADRVADGTIAGQLHHPPAQIAVHVAHGCPRYRSGMD